MFQRLTLRSSASQQNIQEQIEQSAKRYVDIKTEMIESGRLKLSRKNAPPILNGFIPIFIGNIIENEHGTTLEGYFRFHLLAIGLFAGFIGASLLNMLRIYTQDPTVQVLISDPRILFELQFSGFCVLVAIFTWLGGKPFRQHMKSFLHENFNESKILDTQF
ncbi:MAG: hypothetical protein O3A65_02100 [Proteobacteria bacterium]|nr:hypothetical protein [Pseudomonadota bacterium]